jgi:hypothetical protein
VTVFDFFQVISVAWLSLGNRESKTNSRPQNHRKLPKKEINMKLNKLLILGLALILAGCGHGFEGEYTEHVGSSVEFLNAFAQVAGEKTVVIGPDYIDSDGLRTEYKDIFVRESGSQKYLILQKPDDSEEAWKVEDNDTLIRSGGLVSITLKRIKP